MIQLTINDLKFIIKEAEDMKQKDLSLSDTIEFDVIKTTDLHLGHDEGIIFIKSSYSDCNSKFITQLY
jgi:hypothetical protein